MATETDKIINPFKEQDIEFVELPSSDVRYGSDVLGNLKEMQVGSGKYAFYSDESGIWLGGKTFTSAPFSVTMAGVLKATSGTFSGTISGSIITGSTITGGTIQTSAIGERIVLNGANNSLEFWESTSSRVGTFEIYSGSAGMRVGSNFYFFGEDSFFPYLDTDLGGAFTAWRNCTLSGYLSVDGDIDSNSGYVYGGAGVSSGGDFYSYTGDLNLTYGTANIGGNLVVDGSMELNGTTINDWSDISSAPTQSQIEDILVAMGASSATTLRVRRVDSSGIDSGWYYLHFTYGVLDEATIN